MTTIHQENSTTQVALEYAKRGWRVIPLKGKIPVIQGWPEKATTDEKIIREWFENSDRNIGIVCGPESGLLVVDVDDVNALRSYPWLDVETPRVKTKKGAHLYFKWPKGLETISTTKTGILPGVDLRGKRGYVVAPPSIHPDGGRYEWVVHYSQISLASVPLKLRDCLSTRPRSQVVGDEFQSGLGENWERIEMEGADEGERNDTLTRLAGLLLGSGVDPDEALERCYAFGERCRPPMDEGEIERTFESVANLESQKQAEALAAARQASEKVKTDPGAPFTPEALKALKHLQAHNPEEYQRIRAKLKASGVRLRDLDKALQKDGTLKEKTGAAVLVSLGRQADLWHTPENEAYATIAVNGHKEHLPLGSRAFRRWLSRQFYHTQGKVPGGQAMQDAITTLGGDAQFDGERHEVHVRVAASDGRLYLDLADDDWRVVEIGPDGWRVIQDPPVRFRRARGMLPLPVPERGGSLDLLRQYVNLDEDGWTLLRAWLVGALHPSGPYPVLVAQGEQGSGKSELCKMLKAVIDPNVAPLRTIPRDERDLMIAARNGWIVAYDNLSGVQVWLSDAMCRLSTGGGFATRELYQDMDEILIDAKRPIIVNGIDALAVRDDFRDRSIIIDLPRIPEEKRLKESSLWQAFEADRPKILGGLLDLVAHAFAHTSSVHLDHLPRMADFAHWVVASGLSPDFLSVYAGNRQAAAEAGLMDDFLAQGIIKLAPWSGTASDLLGRLALTVDDSTKRTRAWPATPRALSNRLRRLAPTLRMVGVDVSFERVGKTRARHIVLSLADDGRTMADARRTQNENLSSACNHAEPLANSPLDTMADEADANLHTRSVAENFSFLKGEEKHTGLEKVCKFASASSAKHVKNEKHNGFTDLRADDVADDGRTMADDSPSSVIFASACPHLVPGTEEEKALLAQVLALLADDKRSES